jgi:hypothetical protein
MMQLLRTAALAAAALCVAATGRAAPPPSVAQGTSAPALPSILVLKTRVTGQAAATVDATTLSNLAATIFSDSGRYKVVAHEDVVAMLDAEQQKQLAGCDDVSCMADIGNALGTQFLLYTQVGEAGGVTVVSASIIDAAKAAAVDRQSVSVDAQRQIVDAVGVACRRLLGEQVELAAASAPASGFDLWLLAWPAFGVGAVATVVGLGSTGAALYFRDQAVNAASQTTFDSARASGHTANSVALIGYLSGGVLLLIGSAAAVVALLVGPDDDASASSQPAAEVSP